MTNAQTLDEAWEEFWLQVVMPEINMELEELLNEKMRMAFEAGWQSHAYSEAVARTE